MEASDHDVRGLRQERCVSDFVGFVSAVLLAGVSLILPVCIVAAVVRAISATGQRDQVVR